MSLTLEAFKIAKEAAEAAGFDVDAFLIRLTSATYGVAETLQHDNALTVLEGDVFVTADVSEHAETVGGGPDDAAATEAVCETPGVYPEGQEEITVEMDNTCFGTTDLNMRLAEAMAASDVTLDQSHPFYRVVQLLREGKRVDALKEVVALDEQLHFFRPEETEESAAVKLIATLRANGSVEYFDIHKQTVVAEIDCNGTVHTFGGPWIDSKPCDGPACVPTETAPVPEPIIPAAVTGPTMTRVFIDVDACDGVPQSIPTEIMNFKNSEQALSHVSKMSSASDGFFKSGYQEELPEDERFVIIDGECYKIRIDDDGNVRFVKSQGSLQIVDARGNSVPLPKDEVEDYLEGDRSASGARQHISGAEITTQEVEERISPLRFTEDSNGDVYLENTHTAALRTVYKTWYEYTDLSPEEYANLLALDLPDEYFTAETSLQRAAILYEFARQHGITLDPEAAIKISDRLSEELARGMNPSGEGTLGENLQRAAENKVERVKTAIATQQPR